MDEKKQELMSRLEELKQLREEAVQLNLEAVKKEDDEMKAAQSSVRNQKKREKAEKYFERTDAEAKGLDYERIKNRTYTAEEFELWNARLQEKRDNADTGFSDYNTVTFRKYLKSIAKIDVDSIHTQKTEREGIERMRADLERQLAERAKFSRRRKFVEDEDVTYINQRNYHFNKKISRAYDEYTKELRESLERGSAK